MSLAAHADLRQELEKNGSAYVESFNKQDVAGIAALYATGGIHVNAAAGPRRDIAEFYRLIFEAGFNHQQVSVDEVWALGAETALAMGQYRIAGKDKTGAPIERGGIWTATYIREGGKWKILMQTAMPRSP
jgi:ketosteroid isomerase-like protein